MEQFNEQTETTNRLSVLMQPPFGMRFDQWLEARKDLQLKKTSVREAVKRVAKNGVNETEGYSYTEAADVYDLMRPLLAGAKLGFEAEYVSKNIFQSRTGAPITEVDLLITFMDLETGYFEQKMINGAGLDFGDKGIYKAYTGALKYALILEFLIPTGANDPVPGAGDAEGKVKGETPPNDDKATHAAEAPKETAITSEQVGQIKLKANELNTFQNQPVEARSKAMNATYMSLAAKLKIKELSAELLTTLSEAQAAQALQYLDEWIEKKRQVDERNKQNTE